jgi:hypothetical protein
MKCFTHRETEAVGVCRHCGKALCEDCMVVGPTGISCQGCAVRARAPLTSRRRRVLQMVAAVLALLGCGFLYLGARAALDFDPEIPGASPITFLFWAAFLFFQASFSYWMSRLGR